MSITGSADDRVYRVPVDCTVSNPCNGTGRRVSFGGEVAIRSRPPARRVDVDVTLRINAFPAFEIYGQVDNGPPIVIGTHFPEQDRDPEDDTSLDFTPTRRLA